MYLVVMINRFVGTIFVSCGDGKLILLGLHSFLRKQHDIFFVAAVRFIFNYNDSSYERLLFSANIPSLQIRRMRTVAIETFNI